MFAASECSNSVFLLEKMDKTNSCDLSEVSYGETWRKINNSNYV